MASFGVPPTRAPSKPTKPQTPNPKQVAAASIGVPNAGTILAEALRLGKMPAIAQLRAGGANMATIQSSLKGAAAGCGKAACCSGPGSAAAPSSPPK